MLCRFPAIRNVSCQNILMFLEGFSFIYLLHFGNVTNEGGILCKVVELLQLAEVLDVVLPDHLHTHSSTERLLSSSGKDEAAALTPFCGLHLSDELRQAGVAQQQPTSWSDAVGLVLELLWLQRAEITESVGGKRTGRRELGWDFQAIKAVN